MKKEKFRKKMNNKSKNQGFKKDFKHSRNFNTKFQKFTPRTSKELTLSEITPDNKKDYIEVMGVVDRIIQTGGPTIFSVSDGTGSLPLKGFDKPGERAYPEIAESQSIKATVEIDEFNGELEGNIKKISKLTNSEHDKFVKKVEKIQRERAKVEPTPFLVKSKILDKLKDRFIEAATEIRLAILQQRPIIVRHHNDTDGYSSGFVLERAILPLIIKEQKSEKAAWEFFMRAPCAAPYYEIDDSIRDTAMSLRNVAKFSNKMPLVIIADNGSSPEDLLAIQQGKVHGMQFIVIDHHFSSKDVISNEVLVHINPFLVGEDGSHYSAGMLCTELARLISSVENINQIPAMAGYADRIDLGNPQVMKDYMEIARKEGYSKSLLGDISEVIDFVSAKLRFMEAREYIETVFGTPRDKQKALVGLMAPYIEKLKAKGLAISKANANSQILGKTTLQILDIENTFPGFGFYPKPGMCVSMTHDSLQETQKVTNLVTVGVMGTAMTLRATDEANFSVHDFIELLNKKMPEAFVEGGGHKNAGSITFLPNKKDEVFEMLRQFIKSRSK
jgi:RecJ-like exonuclease